MARMATRLLLLEDDDALMAFASYAALVSLVSLVPLLIGRGMASTWAAWALGLGGGGTGRRPPAVPGDDPQFCIRGPGRCW